MLERPWSFSLEDKEQIVSLDVKIGEVEVPVGEVLEIAFKRTLFKQRAPEIPRSAMKSLLKLAVANFYFKCNGIWYVPSHGQAMRASLAVILANLWMK